MDIMLNDFLGLIFGIIADSTNIFDIMHEARNGLVGDFIIQTICST